MEFGAFLSTSGDRDSDNVCYPTVPIIKSHIEAIYKAHNPARLEMVPRLLQMYSGEELSIYHALCDKYKVQRILPEDYIRDSTFNNHEPLYVHQAVEPKPRVVVTQVFELKPVSLGSN